MSIFWGRSLSVVCILCERRCTACSVPAVSVPVAVVVAEWSIYWLFFDVYRGTYNVSSSTAPWNAL